MSVHAPRAPAVSAAAPAAPALLLGALVLILLVLCAASLAVGRAPLDVGQAIAQWLRGESTLATLVLIELRVPRTLLAVLVGGSLGLAGAALQGLLRNPLAEPGIIGVSVVRRALARSLRSTAEFRWQHRSLCRSQELQGR